MKRSVAIIVGLVVAAAAGWYFVSPLFIDNVVDEAFPFEMPDAQAMGSMSAGEKVALEAEMMAALPTEAEVAALPVEDQAAVTDAVMQAAAMVMSDKMVADDMPAAADPNAWLVAGMGSFMGADDFHQGSGSATVFQQGDERVLRFEDFSVTNGPDLHVILTRHPNPANRSDVGEDYITLGPLKGNMGNQNYEIPADVDLSEYQGVVIYCLPFHVVFATAALN